MKSRWLYILATGASAILVFLSSIPYLFKNYYYIHVFNFYVTEENMYIVNLIAFPVIAMLAALLTKTNDKKYDYLDLLINVIIAYVLCLFTKMLNYNIVINIVSLSVLVLGAIILAIYVHKKQAKLSEYIHNLRYMVAIVLAVTLLPMFASYSLYESNFNKSHVRYENTSGISEAEALKELLSEDNWAGLSAQEKTDAVVDICGYVFDKLGLAAIPIYTNNSPLKYNTHGEFSPSEVTITLNEGYILGSSPSDIMHTICHEVYHYYEFSMIDTYLQIINAGINTKFEYFDLVRSWLDASNEYEYDKESYDLYKTNKLEVSANEYADKILDELLN